MSPPGTLRLTWPLGRTPFLALALLALLAAGSEVLASSHWARQHSTLARTGNASAQFDVKLGELDRVEALAGRVECIVLGSSMVNAGFVPEAFRAALMAAGEPPRYCANVGVAGLMAWQAGDVAQLLVSRYHPSLLIFGTSARDYPDEVTGPGFGQYATLTQNPWMDYRLRGRFSLIGWLTDHSYAYRNWLGLQDWLAGLAPRPVAAAALAPASPLDLSQPPDPTLEAGGFRFLSNYRVAPESLAGLEQLLSLQQPGLQVVVVELPVHPTYLHYFERGEADQALFRAAVSAAARAHGVPFWSSQVARAVPPEGFHDRNHLNRTGAAQFSAWLAGQFAASQVRP